MCILLVRQHSHENWEYYLTLSIASAVDDVYMDSILQGFKRLPSDVSYAIHSWESLVSWLNGRLIWSHWLSKLRSKSFICSLKTDVVRICGFNSGNKGLHMVWDLWDLVMHIGSLWQQVWYQFALKSYCVSLHFSVILISWGSINRIICKISWD